MKTYKLTGTALDWAVAKCEGVRDDILFDFVAGEWLGGCHKFSTDWAQGGPIIERQKISTVLDEGATDWRTVTNACSGSMFGPGLSGDNHAYGPTPLIAAMRCYVTSRLGDEIELPEELK